MAGRPWVGAILMVKMKDWKWEMKKCEKEIEGERARPWPERRVIQMKLEAYEKCVFFLYPNAHLVATSYNGPSEWDRASVRGRETAKPHERRLRLHLSFYYCHSQSSTIISTWKFDLPLWPTYCQVLCAPFCFDRKRTVVDRQCKFILVIFFFFF